MRNALSCFGFVSDFSFIFTQDAVITRKKQKHSSSCTDHQLFFTSLAEAYLTVLNSLGFFHFSEPKIKNTYSRLNANTHVERRFECFGNVSGEFRLLAIKQKSIQSFLTNKIQVRGALWDLLMQDRAIFCPFITNFKIKSKRPNAICPSGP
jgi:hypothetical protein